MPSQPRELLIQSFHVAVAAVQADRCLPPHLPQPPAGRTLVLGAGKAASAMAACVEAYWPARAPLSGLVITPHGHGCPTQRIRVVEAGHPLPDGPGLRAAACMPGLVAQLGPDDLLLGLVSGGGSSLLTLPAPGLDLAMLRTVSRGLLRSGAPVQDINIVRKHLSTTLGGQLAAACTAPVLALIISDVVGDDPTHIASGPFCADPSTHADALEVLARWDVAAPERVLAHLRSGGRGRVPDTPKPGDARLACAENRIVATGRTALEAAADWFRRQGVESMLLGDGLAGEARVLAARLAGQVLSLQGSGGGSPRVLLSGGETTVTVRGAGRGGRNGEFALALALALGGATGVHALAADTDGIDGAGDNAGALIDPTTLQRAAAAGLDARVRLDDNDAYGFFAPLGDLLYSGPTHTNANDYRAILLA